MGCKCGGVQCRDFGLELRAIDVKTRRRLAVFAAFHKKRSAVHTGTC